MSQNEQIAKHLQSGKSINPAQALQKYGVFRLAARIHSLRLAGYDVQTKIVSKGKAKIAEYFMVKA